MKTRTVALTIAVFFSIILLLISLNYNAKGTYSSKGAVITCDCDKGSFYKDENGDYGCLEELESHNCYKVGGINTCATYEANSEMVCTVTGTGVSSFVKYCTRGSESSYCYLNGNSPSCTALQAQSYTCVAMTQTYYNCVLPMWGRPSNCTYVGDTCGTNKVLDEDGDCVCAENYHLFQGNCVPNSTVCTTDQRANCASQHKNINESTCACSNTCEVGYIALGSGNDISCVKGSCMYISDAPDGAKYVWTAGGNYGVAVVANTEAACLALNDLSEDPTGHNCQYFNSTWLDECPSTITNGECKVIGRTDDNKKCYIISCNPGAYKDNGVCKTCEAGYYCPGLSLGRYACGSNLISSPGATSRSECTCPANQHISEGSCVPNTDSDDDGITAVCSTDQRVNCANRQRNINESTCACSDCLSRYQDVNGTCQACSLVSCPSNASECRAVGNSCYEIVTCKTGYEKVGNSCVEEESTCTESQVLACENQHKVMDSSSCSCSNECLNGYYNENNTCKICDATNPPSHAIYSEVRSSCYKISGCESGYVRVGNTCVVDDSDKSSNDDNNNDNNDNNNNNDNNSNNNDNNDNDNNNSNNTDESSNIIIEDNTTVNPKTGDTDIVIYMVIGLMSIIATIFLYTYKRKID